MGLGGARWGLGGALTVWVCSGGWPRLPVGLGLLVAFGLRGGQEAAFHDLDLGAVLGLHASIGPFLIVCGCWGWCC